MAEAEKNRADKARTKTSGALSESEVKDIPVGDGEPESRQEPAESPDKSEIKPEADPVQTLEARVTELEDRRLRALADLDNYRKRMARQLDDTLRAANDRILSELLDIADNFERAIAHTNDHVQADAAGLNALKQGTELIYGQLRGLLARYDVKALESIGCSFDPKYHEALVQVESDEYDEGIIAAEINKGYLIGDRVLRHARVVVSKGPAVKKAENKTEEKKAE